MSEELQNIAITATVRALRDIGLTSEAGDLETNRVIRTGVIAVGYSDAFDSASKGQAAADAAALAAVKAETAS